MKKRTKKLVLAKETVVGLDRSGLQGAAGGTGTGYQTSCFTCVGYSCEPDRCPYSDGGTCNTCEGTCTANYC
jgi:hypothetical protein